MLVSVVVSAGVAEYVVVFINMIAYVDCGNGMAAGCNLFMSVCVNYPFVSVLVTVIPGAAVTETVVVFVGMSALVLLGKVVTLRLAPMLFGVKIPFFVVAALAHRVSADVAFSVISVGAVSRVNVSASVLFYGIVSAIRRLEVLCFGSGPIVLVGVLVSFLIIALAAEDTVCGDITEIVRLNVRSVGLNVVSAGKRTPVSVLVTLPALALKFAVCAQSVKAGVAYTVVVCVGVIAFICYGYRMTAGRSLPMLGFVSCPVKRMSMIVIPFALYNVADSVIV